MGMKSINSAVTGLASSLLLNVGLTSVAERFDTVKSASTKANGSAESCVWICNFSAESCVWICNFNAESGK
jgi:hypothetical protein